MPLELDKAIEQCQADVDILLTPKEDTVEWWLLRARSTGLSLLKTMQQQGFTPLQADTFRKVIRTNITGVAETVSTTIGPASETELEDLANNR